MSEPSHQTVRLASGRHRSPAEGACVMELASMLAGEPFSDRPRSVSAVIGGFLRTYNDGLDDERRQDLYAYAAEVVGTSDPAVAERRRLELCLAFAGDGGGRPRLGRLAALWRPAWFRLEQAGHRAAKVALAGTHSRALAFLDELIAAGGTPGERVGSLPGRDRTAA